MAEHLESWRKSPGEQSGRCGAGSLLCSAAEVEWQRRWSGRGGRAARPAGGNGRRVRCSSARRMRRSCSCGKAAASEFLPNLAALTICPAFGGIFFPPNFFSGRGSSRAPCGCTARSFIRGRPARRMRRSRSCSNAAAFRYIVHPRNPRQILSHFLTAFFVAAVKKKRLLFPKTSRFRGPLTDATLRSALVCRVVTRQVARVEPPVG